MNIEQTEHEEISANEAALALGLSPGTLKNWRSTGRKPELKFYKRFKKVFYIKHEVLEFKRWSTEEGSYI
ncbi:MAG: helix-turn-helix domain-containing protein [Oceanospirillales bacterium]|nr:helix-turn-helix domain-containing protein [Oceanospirillales bacterium]